MESFCETVTIYCMNGTFYMLGSFVNSPRMFKHEINASIFGTELVGQRNISSNKLRVE